jgi:hypothetical protein
MQKMMNPRVVLSVILLLAATSVLSTGFTATATVAPLVGSHEPINTNSTQDPWTYVYQQNYQRQTTCLCDPIYHNCSCYPTYPNYPGYPYHHYYSGYGYGYYPGHGYEVVTQTETVTATSYSTVTETSTVTSTTTSIPEPVVVTTSSTVTATTTTKDTTAETLYSTLMAVFLALFLATLVLLVGSRSRGSKGSNPQSSQAVIAAPAEAHIATSHKCSACGADVDPGTKFCGSCGARLKR